MKTHRITIIGAGLSGLSAAYLIKRKAAEQGLPIELQVLEAENYLGGKILTQEKDGFLCEAGPNGFLDNKPYTLELCQELGIDSQLLRSNDNARKRFIFWGGRLHQLPESPIAFLTSSLLSLKGRLRVIAEYWTPKGPADNEETIADFARRRLGQEALDKLLDPMVSGIFAGDPEKMSLISCFPRIVELEQQYGGLLKAMMALQKEKKRDRKNQDQPQAGPAGPGGVLTSFSGGIKTLVEALAQRLEGQAETEASVLSVLRQEQGYLINLKDREPITADIVIAATPAYIATQMFSPLGAALTEPLSKIPYAPMAVISFGYRREKINHSVDGFGYLIPKKENRQILGTLWDSSIFPNRAPEGFVLLRSMAGGARQPDILERSDEELISITKTELKYTMGITAEPDFINIFRWPYAIPQYTLGHPARLQQIEEALASYPGIFLTGNAYRGIGINDCVESAQRVSDKVVAYLQEKK